MGYKLNGVKTGGLPVHLINPLLEKHSIKFFIESGTAGGESIRVAAKMFEECYTIELVEGRSKINIPNTTFVLGESQEKLPGIIKELDGSWAFFWLDAHYSDPEPNTSNYKECPVLEEIEAIAPYPKSVIMIDDARLFLGAAPWPLDPRQWPGIADIFKALDKAFPEHYKTITDDYILCIPQEMKPEIDHEWVSRYKVRYPSEQDKLKEDAKNVFSAIQNYLK